MNLRPILLGLCVWLGLAAMPVAAAAQTIEVVHATTGEVQWRQMTPQRFPGTESAWRTKCAAYVAAGVYTAAWCDQIVSDYLAFKATGSSTVCEPSVSRYGDRFRYGMIGDIASPQLVPNLVQRIRRDIAVTRCTRDGQSTIFVDEPRTGCNNLHVPELVVGVRAAPPPKAVCQSKETVTISPGRVIRVEPFVANGSIYIPGVTVVIPSSINTGVELTACVNQE